jgi:hypothetical protein
VLLGQDFYFTHIISLHSAGGLFYIPDYSIDDDAVTRF